MSARWVVAAGVVLISCERPREHGSKTTQDAAVPPDSGGRPLFVDLTAEQTAIRDRGTRTGCLPFAAIAALEVAYKRAGYGTLDLSEQFADHMGKTLWLHPQWNEVAARGVDGWETRIAALPGDCVAYVGWLANGLRVPDEDALPYRNADYSEAEWPVVANSAAFWTRQRKRSDFNLDERVLPLKALKAARYYSVAAFATLDAKNAAEIEAELAAGREVVWDFRIANTDEPVWLPCAPGQAGCPEAPHSVLLVGYDRRDPDPTKHYFIAKDSKGLTETPGAGGFTYLSYDHLQYGQAASSIRGVQPPSPWPELAFIGRWSIDFDGHRRLMDIYHLPGLMEWQWRQVGVDAKDRRLGVMYVDNGEALRVNGTVGGSGIRFHWDGAEHNLPWDDVGLLEFDYRMVNSASSEMMAGYHLDVPSNTYPGGYARKGGFIPSGPVLPQDDPTRYLGADYLTSFNGNDGVLRFDRIDSTFLTPAEAAEYVGLLGRFSQSMNVFMTQGLVDKARPWILRIRLPELLGDPATGAEVLAKNLSHDKAAIAGMATNASGIKTGFVMVRQ